MDRVFIAITLSHDFLQAPESRCGCTGQWRRAEEVAEVADI